LAGERDCVAPSTRAIGLRLERGAQSNHPTKLRLSGTPVTREESIARGTSLRTIYKPSPRSGAARGKEAPGGRGLLRRLKPPPTWSTAGAPDGRVYIDSKERGEGERPELDVRRMRAGDERAPTVNGASAAGEQPELDVRRVRAGTSERRSATARASGGRGLLRRLKPPPTWSTAGAPDGRIYMDSKERGENGGRGRAARTRRSENEGGRR
jgi:hypothetical protein